MMKKIGSILLASSLMLSLGGSCVSASDSVNETVTETAAETATGSAAETATGSAAEITADTESLKEGVPDQEQKQEQTTEQDQGQEQDIDQNTTTDQECEWNVLLYLCGTDLETNGGCATKSLTDIASTLPQEGVNFLIETGGAKAWDPYDELDFEIANDKLQRWAYGEDGFVLVDEADEACMSDSRTLTDFIRWAGENYSAKKNMLILWDHGGGSCSGLICDENYDFPIMPVYMMEEAIREGGTHFDLVLTDTCLMASLETCQALAPYADYLAASEEIMDGDSTNYSSWVQYLYDRPDCSAVQLGKRICDSTQQYYTDKDRSDAESFFTMSLIDLSKTDAVAEAFNRFMHEAAGLVEDPGAFYEYAYQTHYAENYSLETMFDLFDLSQRAEKGGISKEITHALQDAVEDAVLYNLRSDNHMYSHGLSVYYPMKNEGNDLDHFARSCKNPDHLAFLDSICLNWEAPAWVYEETDRHPEMNRKAYLVVPEVGYAEDESGVYLTLKSGFDAATFLSYALYYRNEDSGALYTLGESGNLIPELDEEGDNYRFWLGFDGKWPTMEGKPLCMSIADETESYILYNVPIQRWNGTAQMRVLVDYEKYGLEEDPEDVPEEVTEDGMEAGAGTEEVTEDGMEAGAGTEEVTEAGTEADAETAGDEETVQEDESVQDEEAAGDDEFAQDEAVGPYELLGIWDGFDAHTGLPGRNITPLSQVDGEDIMLYDVLYSETLNGVSDYISSAETQLTKDSRIDEGMLPEGEYLVRFVIRDVFNNTYYSEYITVNWDGETLSY